MKKGEVAHTPPPPPPLPPPALSTFPRGLPRLPSTKISSATIGQRKSSLEESIRDPVSFAEKPGAPALHAGLRNMGLARAMRALDALRKHTPTKEEIDELGASDRLDTQVSQLGIFCFFVYLGGEKSKLSRMRIVQRNEESGYIGLPPWPRPGLRDVCAGVLAYPPCSTASIF